MKSKLIKTAAVMLTTGTLLAGSLAVANTFVLKLGWNGEDTIKNAINYITSLTKTANQVDQLKAALRAQAEGNVALYKDLEKANYAAEDLKEVLPNPMPDGDGSDDLEEFIKFPYVQEGININIANNLASNQKVTTFVDEYKNEIAKYLQGNGIWTDEVNFVITSEEESSRDIDENNKASLITIEYEITEKANRHKLERIEEALKGKNYQVNKLYDIKFVEKAKPVNDEIQE